MKTIFNISLTKMKAYEAKTSMKTDFRPAAVHYYEHYPITLSIN